MARHGPGARLTRAVHLTDPGAMILAGQCDLLEPWPDAAPLDRGLALIPPDVWNWPPRVFASLRKPAQCLYVPPACLNLRGRVIFIHEPSSRWKGFRLYAAVRRL